MTKVKQRQYPRLVRRLAPKVLVRNESESRYLATKGMRLTELASHNLNTLYGTFVLHAFEFDRGELAVALVAGNPLPGSVLTLRVQLACLYAEAFDSIDCDCKQQLEASLQYLQAHRPGILAYFPERNGRGHGLKMKTILSEVEYNEDVTPSVAAERCGIEYAKLDFLRVVPAIVRSLGFSDPVVLLTDNPEKAQRLKEAGLLIRSVFSLPIDELKLSAQARRDLDDKRRHVSSDHCTFENGAGCYD